ncbi:unnamed protein product [Lymnaea stagnalis]|uniref:Uncharacterized protein n=1 Tax=Lymnaea stagnalis TaxID=6523 RepID=A0AAV2HRL0_LYMST
MRVTVLTRESAVTTVHHQSEILGVDFMLQELQELEPLGLGKHLKQRAENLTRGDQLSPKKDSTQSETLAAVSPQEPTGSQSNTSDPNQQKDAEIPGERRPSLIKSNTTSRACLLM